MLRRHTKTKVRFKFIRMLKDHFMMINNTAKKKDKKRRFYHILSAACLFFQLAKLIKAFIIMILRLLIDAVCVFIMWHR